MQFAIRMDDITPDMDWKKFYRFKALLDQYQIKALLGVVPENKDPHLHKEEAHSDFWEIMKQLEKEGWILAMHGSTHEYVTKKGGIFPLNDFSEFAGLPESVQFEKLQKAKDILNSHGIAPDIFMAPAHSFDNNTLRCLEKLGFHYITDGFGKKPYIRSGLTFLPISWKQSETLKPEKKGLATLVFHVNEMQEKDFLYYEKVFAEHRYQMISYGEYIKKDKCFRGLLGNTKEYFMAKSKFYLRNLMSKGQRNG